MGFRKWWDQLVGKRLTPAELLRKNRQTLNRAIRGMDRERSKMEEQEKTLIAEIKKTAKAGQMEAVKIMAKDLVQTRGYIKKFMLMKAQLQAVLMNIVTLQSQQSISDALRGVTQAMRAMNNQLRLPQIQMILQEFERQSASMGMKQEMISEAIDETMDQENEEGQSADEIVTQVLDELGLQLKDQLSELPEAKGSMQNARGKLACTAGAGTSSGCAEDDELQARLDNLRRDDNFPNFPNVPR